MNMIKRTLAACVLMATASVASAYDFVVVNSTSSRITAIQASEDGKAWGGFDLKGGIPANGKMQLVWSPALDDSGCEWLVKATYADGSESEPATFDFCEEDLELEFAE